MFAYMCLRQVEVAENLLKKREKEQEVAGKNVAQVPTQCQNRPTNRSIETLKRPTDTKRDLLTPKETYWHQKRPTDTKRDLLTPQETYWHQKRPTDTKRDLLTPQETYWHQKRPTDTKKDLLTPQRCPGWCPVVWTADQGGICACVCVCVRERERERERETQKEGGVIEEEGAKGFRQGFGV